MEIGMDWEQRNLISELNKGKEYAQQLKNHVNCLSSPQTPEFLVEKLLSSYEKALSMLNLSGLPVPENNPNFLITSPASGVSDEDSKDQQKVSKKRKLGKRCSEQVKKVCCGNGLEGPGDDGFSWRKYGQKDILGSNFPRGYYRCSHRHSQGCLAVKQVQRSDEDPSLFEVSYRGRHTCLHQITQRSKLYQNQTEKQNSGDQGLLIPATDEKFQRFPSFSFLEKEEEIHQGNLNLQNSVQVSPATSECNYISATTSSCPDDGNFSVQTPESGLTDEITSFRSPAAVRDFDFYNFDFDTNFTFGNWEFL